MGTFPDPVAERIEACDRTDAALETVLSEILKLRAVLAALRVDLVAQRSGEVTGPVPERPQGRPSRKAGSVAAKQAPRLRSRVAQIIVDALVAAGDAGLSGMELNKIVAEQGYSKDSSEKAKVSIKRMRLARHDRIATHWYAAGKGPKRIPGEG